MVRDALPSKLVVGVDRVSRIRCRCPLGGA